MLRKLARIFLAATLLFAAQGALEHPLAHFGESAGAAQSAADHRDGPDAASHPCDMCVAFASLCGMADAGALALRVDAPAAPVPTHALLGQLLPRAPPAFRSQAPPLLS